MTLSILHEYKNEFNLMLVRHSHILVVVICLLIMSCSRQNPSTPTENKISLADSKKKMENNIEAMVRKCIDLGYPIDLVTLQDHERFSPTKGQDGAKCKVTKVESLLTGSSSIQQGQEIYLYPFTTAKSVIVLTRDGGNWIGSEYYEKINELVKKEGLKGLHD